MQQQHKHLINSSVSIRIKSAAATQAAPPAAALNHPSKVEYLKATQQAKKQACGRTVVPETWQRATAPAPLRRTLLGGIRRRAADVGTTPGGSRETHFNKLRLLYRAILRISTANTVGRLKQFR